MPFAATWMQFEGIVYVRQKRDRYKMIFLILCDTKKCSKETTSGKKQQNLRIVHRTKYTWDREEGVAGRGPWDNGEGKETL